MKTSIAPIIVIAPTDAKLLVALRWLSSKTGRWYQRKPRTRRRRDGAFTFRRLPVHAKLIQVVWTLV